MDIVILVYYYLTYLKLIMITLLSLSLSLSLSASSSFSLCLTHCQPLSPTSFHLQFRMGLIEIPLLLPFSSNFPYFVFSWYNYTQFLSMKKSWDDFYTKGKGEEHKLVKGKDKSCRYLFAIFKRWVKYN